MDNGQEIPPQYSHPLFTVLLDAITQAMFGKGQRHGGATTPFLEQPWRHYADLHGRGFLTGQAAKKLEEAASTKNGEAFIQELRGAIVYCGMAILYEQGFGEKFSAPIIGKDKLYPGVDFDALKDDRPTWNQGPYFSKDEVEKAVQQVNEFSSRMLSDLLSREMDEEIQIIDSCSQKVKLNKHQLAAIQQVITHPYYVFSIEPKEHRWEYRDFDNDFQQHKYVCVDCKEVDYRSRQQERSESNNICYSLSKES